MDYKQIQKFYNYKIYLEILDNTIINYKRDILMKQFKLFTKGELEYNIFYNKYNKYNFELIKDYVYYYNIFVLDIKNI